MFLCQRKRDRYIGNKYYGKEGLKNMPSLLMSNFPNRFGCEVKFVTDILTIIMITNLWKIFVIVLA